MTGGEMIEPVAKAIVTAMFDDIPPESDLWNAYVGPARAAIEALREPTEAMLAAARGALKDHIDSVPEDERGQRWGFHRMPNGKKAPSVSADEKARIRFVAMIDKASGAT